MPVPTRGLPKPTPTLPTVSPEVRVLAECDNATLRQAILYLETKLTLAKLEEEMGERGFGATQLRQHSKVGMIEMRLASLRVMEQVTSSYAYIAANAMMAATGDDGRR